jgi:hypothetical protein
LVSNALMTTSRLAAFGEPTLPKVAVAEVAGFSAPP